MPIQELQGDSGELTFPEILNLMRVQNRSEAMVPLCISDVRVK